MVTTGKSDTRDWLEWVVKNPEHLSYTADGFRRKHTPGSVARVAIEEIDRLRADVQRLRAELEYHLSIARNAKTPESIDCYPPSFNSTLGDAPLRSPEEQFTRRMLREAIARCLFPDLPDEREWEFNYVGPFSGFYLYNDNLRFFISREEKEVALYRYGDLEWATIPAPIWDKAWRECGMEDR